VPTPYAYGADKFIKMNAQILDITETIINKLKTLPLEQQRQILEFVEFIAQRYTQQTPQENQPNQKRIAGLHKGKIWMSDDFNEPLNLG
jgi:hypothetical protein